MMRRVWTSFLFLFLATLASVATAQDTPKTLDQIVAMLVSDDVDTRREARVLLEQYLEALDPARQKDEIGKLCAKLWPADYREQLGLAIALSQLKTPWESSRQDDDIQKLYTLMQQTKDDTLRRYLDDALANAKGLYFDAINDYNTIDERDLDGEIARIREVTAKFRRMAAMSESVYSGNAVFYLGQYLARLATIFGGRDESLNARLIAGSDKAFEQYMDQAKGGAYRRPAFLHDAFFYRALNQVIAGKPAQAIELLKRIPDTDDDRIYVYQFFYSKDEDTIVDRTVNGGRLIKATIDYLSNNRDDPIGNQMKLVKNIGGLKLK
jgi:hypothetical protein